MPHQVTPLTKSTCLIIGEHSPESYSPAGERLRHMALASGRFFSKTIVLTSGRAEKQAKRDMDAKVLLYKTGVARAIPFPISALFDPITLLAFLVRGLVLSTRYKPLVILASMPPVETGASAWLLAKVLRKKMVIDYMDDWESSMRTQLTKYVPAGLMLPVFEFAKLIYSFSSAFFVVTPTLASILRQRSINSSIFLAPNGADLVTFSCRDAKSRREVRLKHGLPLNKTVLVYCGSTNPYYRLDLVLLAVNSLPNYVKEKVFSVFYLYGNIARYRRLKAFLKIPDDLVEIRDALPRKDLSEIMAACDAGLVPFDDSSFLKYAMSTKVYEYLGVGLYVISSGPNEGELRSFFSRNADCGTFVQPRVKDLVCVLTWVAKNDKDLFENGVRSSRHSFIARNYDSEEIMTKAMACLSTLRGLAE